MLTKPLAIAAAAAALGLALSGPAPVRAQAEAPTAPIAQGQKYFMATHSFSVFIGGPTRGAPTDDPGPLQKLAKEAGKDGHEVLGVQMIGGSTPMQHWRLGGSSPTSNPAKAALVRGGVDVLTLSPGGQIPEPGVDLFADLLIKTNPEARLLVQHSWSARGLRGADAQAEFTVESHNAVTLAQLQAAEPGVEAYLARLRGQLDGVNARAGKPIAYVVPAASAVSQLRRQILANEVPGLTRQSDLFIDAVGHPKPPLANLVSYVWFAVMYRQSPLGLTAFVNPADPTSAPRERLLQQIAWNAAVGEPMSGVKGPALALD